MFQAIVRRATPVILAVAVFSVDAVSRERVSLGPEVLVSENADGGRLRCEPSVAAAGNTIVVTWNDSYGGRHGSPTGVAIAWALSKDRGYTYSFGGYLPREEGRLAPSGADSTVLADRDGNFFLLLLSWQKEEQILFLYEMRNERPGVWIPRSRFSSRDAKLDLIDRPSMSIDARGRIWISFTTRQKGEPQIAVIRSADRGRSWGHPVMASSGPGTKVPSRLIIEGETVTAAWVLSSETSAELWRADSVDGGKTYSRPTRLASGKSPGTIPGYVMGISKEASAVYFPNFAIEGSGHRPDLGVVIDLPTEKGYEVVQGDLPSGRLTPLFPGWSTSFFSAVARTPRGIAVLAYGRRTAAPLTDVCLSVPTENGRRTVLILNSIGTDWSSVSGDPDAAPVQRNFGDYISLTPAGDYLVAVWTDGRSGAPRIFSRVIRLSEERTGHQPGDIIPPACDPELQDPHRP